MCVCVCVCKHPIFISIQRVIFTFPLFPRRCGPTLAMASFLRFQDHIGLFWTSDQFIAETFSRQHTILTRDRQPCPPARFEPTIPASERPQTHALRPRCYWDRRDFHFCAVFFFVNLFSHQPIFNLPLDCDVNYIFFSISLVDVIASAAPIINLSAA